MNPATRAMIRLAIILSLPLAANNKALAAEEEWTANWSCGSSSQCASVMGGSSGSAGPFSTKTDCDAWGRKYIPGGYSCAVTATDSKYIPPPSNGGAPVGGGYTLQQQIILNGAYALGVELGKALRGDPAEAARKAQEAARLQMLQQQAIAEDLRKAELAKQR